MSGGLLRHRLAMRLKASKGNRRRLLAGIAGLSGADYVAEANRYAQDFGRRDVRFEQEAESGLFRCLDTQPQWFAHRQRLEYYTGGTAARGRKLAEEYLLAHVPLADGDRIVEVGANVGDFSLALLDRGVKAHMISVEPSPREFAALDRNLAANPNVLSHEALNVAAWSDSAEAMTFYVKSETADSSLLPIEDYDEKIEVPTRRLSDLVQPGRYRLLKLEAEGAEPEILDGAGDLLDSFDYIAADVGFERGMRQDSTLPEVVNRLVPRRFRIKAMGRNRLVLLFEREGVTT